MSTYSNMYDFYVGYDKYVTESEDGLPSASDWYKGAEFAPLTLSDCKSMKSDEELIWRNLNAGRHILISGKAGSGKSHLLSRFVANCKNAYFSQVLTAPTGIAAFNVNGETLHRRLGLGLADDDPVTLFQLISNNKKKYVKTWKFLSQTDVLIIDEISMVSPVLFEKLNYLFKQARKSTESFGGVKLIMVGDFTQLGPVIRHNDEKQVQEKFVLDTEAWQTMSIARIFLVRSYRQSEGDPFLNLLNSVREGKLSPADKALLRSRINADVSIKQTTENTEDEKSTENLTIHESVRPYLHIQPIDIFPYNSQVEKCNTTNLNKLRQKGFEVKSFTPFFRISRREEAKSIKPRELKRAQDFLNNKGPSSFKDKFPVVYVKLTVGCQVMMRSNAFFDLGIFNGSLGIVTDIQTQFVSVLFVVDGKFLKQTVDVKAQDFTYRFSKTVNIVMKQVPLSLAYATTIHKCQGLTLDSVRVDASNCFEPGQLYVALSRVRKLDHLSLIGFDERSLLADDRAVEFERVNSDALCQLQRNKRCKNVAV